MTSHTDVVATFAAALTDFLVDHDGADGVNVHKMFNTIAAILYSLKYNTVGGVPNHIGIIEDHTAYTTTYGEAFLTPKRPETLDSGIDTKEVVSLASQKAETMHRSVPKDRSTYCTATTDSIESCVAVFGFACISSLSKGGPMLEHVLTLAG